MFMRSRAKLATATSERTTATSEKYTRFSLAGGVELPLRVKDLLEKYS